MNGGFVRNSVIQEALNQSPLWEKRKQSGHPRQTATLGLLGSTEPLFGRGCACSERLGVPAHDSLGIVQS